jgi:hypothetical protein
MSRPPYDAHLCALDPQAFEAGFRFAGPWVGKSAAEGQPDAIYRAIKDSTGIPFPETARKVGLNASPWTEGFMLGVYGHVGLQC